MVPHHGTNWAALRLTAQIGRDAVLSESYGRGYRCPFPEPNSPPSPQPQEVPAARKAPTPQSGACPKEESKHEEKEGVQPSKRSNKSLEQGLNLSGS